MCAGRSGLHSIQQNWKLDKKAITNQLQKKPAEKTHSRNLSIWYLLRDSRDPDSISNSRAAGEPRAPAPDDARCDPQLAGLPGESSAPCRAESWQRDRSWDSPPI